MSISANSVPLLRPILSDVPRTRKSADNPPPLSLREIRFCQKYAETDNATRSYLDAGFEPASEHAATEAASKLLRKPDIRSYLDKLRADAAEAAQVTVDEVARGFRRAANADVTRLLGPDGEMLPPSQWPEDVRLCIVRMEVEELTEWQGEGRGRKKVAIGTKWKVWLENKTECRKVLAQWKRMLAEPEKPKDEGGEEAGGVSRELAVRILAAIGAVEPRSAAGGSGGTAGESPVVAQSGAAEPGVSE